MLASKKTMTQQQNTTNEASILTHLHELRRRFQIAIIAYVIGVMVLMNFSSIIFDFMAIPLRSALPPNTPLVFLNAPDVFFTYLKIALVLSIFVTAPITFYQVWAFIAPGLYKHERKLFLGFFISSLVLLFSGAAFAFYAVFPMIFSFFLSFSSDTIQAMPAIKEYLTLVLKLLFAFGISFQVPIIVIALTRLDIMDVDSLATKRRYVIVWAFIFSAVLTPPDIISQVMLAIPMYALFEVGIVIARRMEAKSEKPIVE
ncbi:MAG: twin-arginine translocase subunit TatC [Zetaproteobacteria bacterium]|nr:twin-arginine translocase subunit TatC [Zetaproteobacteria bacterium]